MTATNHALTGAIIGLTVHNPWIALPAAFLSHIICDMIPHFAPRNSNWMARRSFKVYLLSDALLCGVLVLILYLVQPQSWILAAICAFLATSPDFLWIREFVVANRGQTIRPTLLEKWLAAIQWFERPIGAIVEVAWAIAGIALISSLLSIPS